MTLPPSYKGQLSDLATSCPNVVCKCGGFQQPGPGVEWDKRATPVGSEELASAVLPRYQAAIDAFGPDREL
jgi:hypothetical protein